MILGLGVLQLNTFLDGLIAGWPAITGQSTIFGHDYPLGPKALATLTYAQRLYEFPLGVFGIAVATRFRNQVDGNNFHFLWLHCRAFRHHHNYTLLSLLSSNQKNLYLQKPHHHFS